jgi:CHRD domain
MRRTVRTALVLTFAATATVLLSSAAGALEGGKPAIPLNNEQETTGATGGGSGFFSYSIEGLQLCYTLEVSNLTMDPFAAHIHLGPRNVAGGIVVGLLTPTAATSTVNECITAVDDATGPALSTADLAAIAADPGAYYVNVHTNNFPGGEVRGQLK